VIRHDVDMVTDVRVALATTILALGVAVAPPAVLAHSEPANPSPAKIRGAIRAAERSKDLWATVNICNTRRYPNSVGVRGQMPTLGFPAWLSMDVQLSYYNKQKKRFMPDPHVERLVRLGRWSSGLQQDGAIFSFGPHAGRFDATIEFFWRRAGKLLGETTRSTTGGHRSADFGSPAHHTASECRIS
jgi:hypothetical protein